MQVGARLRRDSRGSDSVRNSGMQSGVAYNSCRMVQLMATRGISGGASAGLLAVKKVQSFICRRFDGRYVFFIVIHAFNQERQAELDQDSSEMLKIGNRFQLRGPKKVFVAIDLLAR